MFRLKIIRSVFRQTGLGAATSGVLAVYFVCAVIIYVSEPTAITFGDSLWLCFQTMATIGFGDVPADVPLARAVLVALSLVSVFYLAVLTGSFASYCTNIMQSRAKSTVVRMAAQLEHLEGLSRDELAELSRQARDLSRQVLGEEAATDARGRAHCNEQ